MPQRIESFSLEEDSGSDPVPSCKSKVKESKFCSPENTPCSIQKELKNRYKKDIYKIEASVEGLISNNPCSSDPYDIKDNGSQVLASKCNLKDRQLNENNSIKYDKCLQDKLDKKVIA